MELQPGSWMFSDEEHWHKDAEMEVLPKVVFAGGLRVSSRDDWTPLRTYVEGLPDLKVVDGSMGSENRPRIAARGIRP